MTHRFRMNFVSSLAIRLWMVSYVQRFAPEFVLLSPVATDRGANPPGIRRADVD